MENEEVKNKAKDLFESLKNCGECALSDKCDNLLADYDATLCEILSRVVSEY